MGFGEGTEFDITGAASLSEERLQTDIAHCLQLKGYCVIELGLEEEKLYDVIDDLKDLRGDSRFVPPPQEVVDGLLGAEGSGEFAWLAYPDTPEGDDEGENIRILDRKLLDLANSTSLFCQQMGHHYTSRTESVVLRGGEPDYEGPELTEETCSKWLSILTQAKLMMLYFLGPGEGFLELQPFDDDAGSVELETKPDMMIILRSDMIGHKHMSSIRDYTVCSWITTPDATSSRGWPSLNKHLIKTVPAAKELVDWTQARLEALLEMEMNDPEWEGVPREWQLMMRHSFFKSTQNPVAIRGESSHVPGKYDGEALWMAEVAGFDAVLKVPYERWDHSTYYDPDPNSYLSSHAFPEGVCKTNIQHMMYCDGTELFDNKFFGMSISESKSMDPCQRHILETSYGALFGAGFKKKDLMNNYIAVFTGCTNPEWNYVPHEAGAQSGTGGSQAITSNRVSFLLGMMGPSTSIDCDMASSGMACMLGCTAVNPSHGRREESGGFSNAAVVGGVYFALTPFMWPRVGAFLNPNGRCFSFDGNANGYVRGESCISVALRPYMELIDDKYQPVDAKNLGTIVGWRMVNNGRGASLTAPYGPAEQETTHDAVKHAGISELDVDAMDCHGIGNLLADSVELSSLAMALRGMKGGEEEVLLAGAVKTNLAATCEGCAMAQLLKVMYNILYANNCPALHLKQMNPHAEVGEAAVAINNESVAYRGRSAFHGLSTRGVGGTNICLIPWFQADENRIATDKPEWQGQPFAFWPGGGGMLENEAKPMEGYYIIGSWNEWKPQEMERSPDGDFLCNVTLGINGWECFQFLLDGESDKVLHPGIVKAWSGSHILGPTTAMEADVASWLIDGRVETYSEEGVRLGLPSPEEEGAVARSDGVEEAYSRDKGVPGDQYQIKLQVAGKYRAVSWKKLETSAEDREALSNTSKVNGKYYVTGAWNGWSFEEMEPVNGEPGRFSLEVRVTQDFSKKSYREFQIVRNKDLDQNFFPPDRLTSLAEVGEVLGPGEGAGAGINWLLEGGGVQGSFVIDFYRKVEQGKEIRKVSWTRKGS